MDFCLAHEYLHAGLQHQKRCNGRDFFLWNIACDYVINDWLHEMEIGRMPPDGLLYDETLHNKSAESIYDLIVKEIRKYKKLNTFRGFGRGDMFNGNRPHFTERENGVSLDELLKNALWEGLDYHQEHNRGFLPAGLVQEIRALAMPVIPWDAALAKWFDVQFPPLEKTPHLCAAEQTAGCHAGYSKARICVLRAGSGEPDLRCGRGHIRFHECKTDRYGTRLHRQLCRGERCSVRENHFL